MDDGCEVRDYVASPMDSSVWWLRMLNEAANVELRRRGQPELTEPSGELTGDAIAWVPTPETCGAPWLEPGTL